MSKRRSVEEFRKQYPVLVRGGKLVAFRALLAQYPHLTVEMKRDLEDQFKRDALKAQQHEWPPEE
jgi:hypothetical protein